MKDFFDKVREKIDEGMDTITSKSREAIELSRLRNQLRQLEKEKESKINELGRLTYDLLRRGEYNEERIREFYAEINNLDRLIVKLDNEIKQVQLLSSAQHDVKCECGALLSPNQKFCAVCGKDMREIVTEAIKPAKGMKRCPSCGSEIKETAKFCGKCGVKQDDVKENE